jgi:hypothetical protein
MGATAPRIGGVLNQADLGRTTAVSRPAVHRCLLLETS